MKIKLIFFAIASFITIYSSGQFCSITDVTPSNVLPGKINNLTVTLNKSIEEGDTILNVGLWIYFTDYIHDTLIFGSSLETNDSLVHIKFDIPNLNFVQHCNLFMDMIIDNKYDSISINSINIGKEILFIEPSICIVKVDSSNKNIIIWQTPANTTLDSVYVYKETSVLNEYTKIGAKAYSDVSMFKDEASISAQNSNRYKISFKDSSGDESQLSQAHKTIHLSINEAVGGAVNLAWDNYEGFNYSTYHIYRGSSKNSLMKIADIASNLYTFSDIAPPLGELYYQVVVTKAYPCVITGIDPEIEDLNSSKSNFQTYRGTSKINDQLVENSIAIYPNPVKNDLNIQLLNENSGFEVAVFDMTGRLVRNPRYINNDSSIDLSDLQEGMYIVKISNSNLIISNTIIKE